MFGIGMPELLLILAVALIVIGPKKLPDLARSMGKAMGEFKRATNDLKQTIEQETGLGEVRESLRETQRDIRRSIEAGDRRPSPARGPADDIKTSEGESGSAATAPDADGPSPAGSEDKPESTKDNGSK